MKNSPADFSAEIRTLPDALRAVLEAELGAGRTPALFLHGKADEPFAWAHRPFFLRFNTPEREARRAVFCELAAWIGVTPEPFL